MIAAVPQRLASAAPDSSTRARHLDPDARPAVSRAARIASGELQLELRAQAALTDLAWLLGRRAAQQEFRQSLGFGHAGFAPLLLVIVLVIGAAVIGFHVPRGF